MEEYLKKINSSDSHGEQSINWVTHQKCHDMFILSKVRTYIDTYIRVFYIGLCNLHYSTTIKSIISYLINRGILSYHLKGHFVIQKYTNDNLF